MTFNQILWDVADTLGWRFWVPLVPMGAYLLWKLYHLAPALSLIGRLLRVVMAMASLCLIGTAVWNGLGLYAIHLLALGACLWVARRHQIDVEMGRLPKPTAPTVVERLAEKVAEPKVKA